MDAFVYFSILLRSVETIACRHALLVTSQLIYHSATPPLNIKLQKDGWNIQSELSKISIIVNRHVNIPSTLDVIESLFLTLLCNSKVPKTLSKGLHMKKSIFIWNMLALY